MSKQCQERGCERPAYVNGLCTHHIAEVVRSRKNK
jgi:hypothetical protein